MPSSSSIEGLVLTLRLLVAVANVVGKEAVLDVTGWKGLPSINLARSFSQTEIDTVVLIQTKPWYDKVPLSHMLESVSKIQTL